MIDREENEEVRRGRGRPKKIEGSLIRNLTWITAEDKDMLDEMSTTSGKSKSDLIRRMIQLYYYMNYGKW